MLQNDIISSLLKVTNCQKQCFLALPVDKQIKKQAGRQ